MADNWQMKAIHQQFEVFNDLKESYCEVPLSDCSQLINKVNCVRTKHLLLDTNEKISPVRNIVAEILIRSPENEKKIKFSFVVIIMNKETSRGLCKVPVFCVKNGNQKIFIDINCSIYLTWAGFLEGNDLPACQFCFPVDGKYDVGGKLKIDFTKSPATSTLVSRIPWRLCLGGLVVCASIAASYFFKIPQSDFKHAKNLLVLADMFYSGFNSTAWSQGLELIQAVQKFRDGKLTVSELMVAASKALTLIVSKYKNEISGVWEKVREELIHLYYSISRKFYSFYYSASESSRHSFLAITNKVDGEGSLIENKVNSQLKAARENNNRRPGSITETQVVSKESTTVFPPLAERGKIQREASRLSDKKEASNVQQIFQNCKNEYIFHHNMMKDDAQSFSQHTQDMLEISHNLANKLQNKNLDDVQDLFVSLGSVVQQEYEHQIENYTRCVNAARESAGHMIDLEKFNKLLNIVGDPKEHYWKEALQSIQKDRLFLRLKEKIKETQQKKKLCLIPFRQKNENDIDGLYKSIGVRRTGIFSAEELLCELGRMSPCFKKNNVVINETNSMIVVRTMKYIVFALQEVDETNSSEGFVYIVRH